MIHKPLFLLTLARGWTVLYPILLFVQQTFIAKVWYLCARTDCSLCLAVGGICRGEGGGLQNILLQKGWILYGPTVIAEVLRNREIEVMKTNYTVL
jgi:hypothetical protein